MNGPVRDVPAAIRKHLDGMGIEYRHLRHGPTPTSEDSARERGEPLEIGAKALVLKVDAGFITVVLSAAKRLDSGAVKRLTGSRSCRFATREELMEGTGLAPGSVPPFGPPILPFDLYVDEGILELPRVAFNCGSLTESIVMGREEYLRAAGPGKVAALAARPG